MTTAIKEPEKSRFFFLVTASLFIASDATKTVSEQMLNFVYHQDTEPVTVKTLNNMQRAGQFNFFNQFGDLPEGMRIVNIVFTNIMPLGLQKQGDFYDAEPTKEELAAALKQAQNVVNMAKFKAKPANDTADDQPAADNRVEGRDAAPGE